MSAAEAPWTLRYDPRVPRRLAKVNDRVVLRRLDVAACRLEKRPRLGKLLKGYHEVRSYRVGTPGGEYRVLYRLMMEDRVVLVLLIAPRDEVYETRLNSRCRSCEKRIVRA